MVILMGEENWKNKNPSKRSLKKHYFYTINSKSNEHYYTIQKKEEI